MKSLTLQLGAMLLVTVVAAVFSETLTAKLTEVRGIWPPLAAGIISLPVGAIVIVYFHRKGVNAESIIAGMLIRVFLTALLAGISTLFFEDLRVPSFFLALGVIYLANLGLETWFALDSKSGTVRIRSDSKSK